MVKQQINGKWQCGHCKEWKLPGRFYKNKNRVGGIGSRCKICCQNCLNKGKLKEYRKKYQKENKDRLSEKSRKYHKEHKDRQNEMCRKYYKKNRERLLEVVKRYREENRDKIRERARKRSIKNKFKNAARKLCKQGCEITEKQLKGLYKQQNKQCKICGKDLKNNKIETAIDHCHNTNKVRGWLCQRCNRGLGIFNDSPSLLRKAANYLESYS